MPDANTTQSIRAQEGWNSSFYKLEPVGSKDKY